MSGLAVGRQIVVVSGTNGKTTTSHLLAAALRTSGPTAHNATGSNMADGAVAALAAAGDAAYAVLEVDEWHLATVARAVQPAVVVLLNLTRDQLDRGSEVRAVATAVGAALAGLPRTPVVANVDDPMVVWAAGNAARVCWVAAGAGWLGDTATCPRCGALLRIPGSGWSCRCGLARPEPDWWLDGDLPSPRTPPSAWTSAPAQLPEPSRPGRPSSPRRCSLWWPRAPRKRWPSTGGGGSGRTGQGRGLGTIRLVR